jgi:hypothetical protein
MKPLQIGTPLIFFLIAGYVRSPVVILFGSGYVRARTLVMDWWVAQY